MSRSFEATQTWRPNGPLAQRPPALSTGQPPECVKLTCQRSVERVTRPGTPRTRVGASATGALQLRGASGAATDCGRPQATKGSRGTSRSKGPIRGWTPLVGRPDAYSFQSL